MDWVLCCFEFVSIADVHMCCAWKGCWFSDRKRLVAQQRESQERKWFEKEKRRGKVVWGKRASFLLLCDCVFHSILFPLSIHHVTTLLPTHTLTHHTPHHSTPHKHTCVLSSSFLCVWLSGHSIHTQPNNTTPCNHAITTHGITNGWYYEWMGKSTGDWGHHTTNTKHHNKVMGLTSLGLIGCMEWASTLITTPQGQEWGEVTRRKRWLEKEGWHKKRSATFVCLFDITQTICLLSESQKEKRKRKRNAVTSIPRGKHHFLSDQWS